MRTSSSKRKITQASKLACCPLPRTPYQSPFSVPEMVACTTNAPSVVSSALVMSKDRFDHAASVGLSLEELLHGRRRHAGDVVDPRVPTRGSGAGDLVVGLRR